MHRWGVTGWPSTRSAYRTQPGERAGPSAPHSGFLLLPITHRRILSAQTPSPGPHTSSFHFQGIRGSSPAKPLFLSTPGHGDPRCTHPRREDAPAGLTRGWRGRTCKPCSGSPQRGGQAWSSREVSSQGRGPTPPWAARLFCCQQPRSDAATATKPAQLHSPTGS